MVIKKILPVCLFLVSFAIASAEWKNELAGYLGSHKDYQEAAGYLLSIFEKIDEKERPAAFILLAYCFNKLNDRAQEKKWIIEYFETSSSAPPPFDFLDYSTSWEVVNFLSAWKVKYPLITDIFLVGNKIESDSPPPSQLPIGIDITTDAFYKFSDGQNAIMGGLLRAGFNIINVESYGFFESSGSHRYLLEVKSGDIILRKEIEVKVVANSPALSLKPSQKDIETDYKLSMFVNGKLIVSSKKPPQKNLDLTKTIPFNAAAYNPSIYVNKDKPALNTVSILSAAALAYELLKGLKKGKALKQPEYKIQRLKFLTVTFQRKDLDGIEREIKATIELKTRPI